MSVGRTVLGIDPGTATLGYGIVTIDGDGTHYRGCGALTTSAAAPLPERLLQLHRGLREIIAEFAPTEVAVEQLFFSRNVTTAIAVGQARGVALLAVAEAGLPVAEYSPPQVKQAVVGDGRADKERVQEMVRLILGLDRRPEPDDAADGLALAICHANSRHFRERVAASR